MSRLTKEALQKIIDAMHKINIDNDIKKHQLSIKPFWPSGIPIIESPHIQDLEPVIKLSEHVNVSPEFRDKCNQFYIDMFGYKEPMIFKTQYGLLVGKNMCSVLTGNSTA